MQTAGSRSSSQSHAGGGQQSFSSVCRCLFSVINPTPRQPAPPDTNLLHLMSYQLLQIRREAERETEAAAVVHRKTLLSSCAGPGCCGMRPLRLKEIFCREFPACVAAFSTAGCVSTCLALAPQRAPRIIWMCTCSRFAASVQMYTHIVGL